MKKLFHQLCIIAIFAITVTSCSKSSNDLVANEKTVAVKASSMQIANSNYGTVIETETSIYKFINQPVDLVLGDPEKSIIVAGSGEFAVFYVLVSQDYLNEPIKLATLTVADAITGKAVGDYELINTENAELYEVAVPNELKGVPAMFAIVNLENLSEFSNTPLNIYSNIITEKGTLVSRMPNAFVYQQ